MLSKPGRMDLAIQLLFGVLVTFFFFLPSPGLFESCDFSRMNGIDSTFYADAIRHGHLPFWNPYINLGRPYLADVETSVLYPPQLLLALLGVRAGTILLCILHSFLGAIGMWMWARYLGASRLSAHIAAASWIGCSAMAGRLLSGQTQFYFSGSYVPWLMFLAFTLRDGPSVRKVAWIALVASLTLLAGHPQVFWVSALGMGLVVVGTHLELPAARSLKRGLSALGALVGALLGSLGICAAQLLPLAQLIQHSNRRAPSLDFAAFMALPVNSLITFVTPVSLALPFDWEYNLYCGALAFLAAVPMLFRVKTDRNARAILFISVASLIIALGTQTPLFELLFHILPGVSSFRIHARVAFIAVVSFLPLGALGISRIEQGAERGWVTPLIAGLMLAVILFKTDSSTGEKALRLLLPLSACGVLLFLNHRAASERFSAKSLPNAKPIAVAALVLVLLMDIGTTLTWVRKAYEVPPVEANDTNIVAMLRNEKLYLPNNVPPRVSIPPQVMRENAGMLYHYSTFNGYTALTLERPWLYMHRMLDLEPSELTNTAPSPYIFQAGPFPYKSMNLQVNIDGQTGAASLNPNPDPRAYLAGHTERVSSWLEALEKMRAERLPGRTTYVEDDRGMLADGPDVTGRAEIERFSDEEIDVVTHANRPTLLILSEAWYPGWRGECEGVDAPCIPVNAWMRAFAVPAGSHRVRIYFKQEFFALGVLISALSVLLVTAGIFFAPSKKQGEFSPAPPSAIDP